MPEESPDNRRLRGLIALAIGLALAVVGFAVEAPGLGVIGLLIAAAGGVLWVMAASHDRAEP